MKKPIQELLSSNLSFSRNYSRYFFVLSIFTISLLSSMSSVSAQFNKDKIIKILAKESRRSSLKIKTPRFGSTVPSGVGSFYNQITGEFTITGSLSKIPRKANSKFLKILANGRDIGKLTLKKPKAGKVGNYANGRFSVKVVSPVDPQWPIKDFLVELVYTKTDSVIARDYLSIYDLRYEQNATTSASISNQPLGLTAQLTDSGVGVTASDDDPPYGLEIPLIKSLPYPSLEEFNGLLKSDALGLSEKELTDVEECISFADLSEDNFKDANLFPAYSQALNKAREAKVIYDIIKNNQAQCNALFPGIACALVLQGYCVKDDPQPEDFRLCVGKVREKASDLSIPAISDVDLSFKSSQGNSSAVLEAQIEFAGYHGSVDAFLRNLSVRWKSAACLYGKPSPSEFDDFEISKPEFNWIDQWTHCHNLDIETGEATTRVANSDSALFSINRHPVDAQKLKVTDLRLPTFKYSGNSRNSQKESCGLSFINPTVDGLLELFRPAFQSIVQSEWTYGSPDSPTAQAVDLLFTPFHVGENVETDFNFYAVVDKVTSEKVAGLKVQYQTDAEVTVEDDRKRLKSSYFSQGSGALYDGSQGLDFDDSPFDLSYDVTVGILNKVLWVRGASNLLNFEYKPTYGDLAVYGISAPSQGFPGLPGLPGSIPGPSGGSSNSSSMEAELTGDLLSAVHPAFAEIGSKKLEIHIERSMDPVTFMLTDPLVQAMDPNLGIKMAYGVNSLDIKIKEKDKLSKKGKIKKVGKVWLELQGGFIDRNFTLNHDATFAAQKMTPQFNEDVVYVNVKHSQFANCARFTHDVNVAQEESCERLLESALALFFKERIRANMSKMLSEIPAPQFYSLEGLTDFAVQSSGTSKFQKDQRVNNFSVFNQVQN